MNIQRKKLPTRTTPEIRAYEEAFKRGQKSQHVVKTKDGWAVKKMNATKPSKVFSNKEGAVRYGRQVAKNSHSDLFIHDRSGRIQKSHSY